MSFTTPTHDAAWRCSIMSTCCQGPKGKSAPLGVLLTTNDTGRARRSRLRDCDASVNRFRWRAPYLGREHDNQLREIFTKYGRKDIFTYNVPGLLEGTALADDAPLAKLIEKYVDDAFLQEIAGERRKGRILLIGTTNLDTQRPVLWDMGRIAMSNNRDAMALFRKILLASATLPGVFPPVRIQVRD